MNTPSVLVTGASGFVGRALVRLLRRGGWIVHPLVRRPTGDKAEHVADLGDPAAMRLLDGLPPVQGVAHLGARVALRDVSVDDLLAPNVFATGLVAEWAHRRKAHLIYASTILVYGNRTQLIDSGTPLNLDTPYAYTKWLGEERVRAAGGPGAILRVAGVFGRNGPAHLGLNRAIEEALHGIPPTLTGDGAGRRNYVYVRDLADVLMACLRERISGIHLVGGPTPHTVAELLQIICDELLPGSAVLRKPGASVADQVVVPSPVLPLGRPFRDAIQDIREEAAVCA